MNTPSTTPPSDLDHFETALLSELREHVASRPVTDDVPVSPPTRRRYGRWAAGFAVAAATATAVVIASPGGPGASPAYAVDQAADGDVVVTIHRLEDAAGLEAALAEHGIDAKVSYQPAPADEDGIITYTWDADGAGDAPPEDAEQGTHLQADPQSGVRKLDQAGAPPHGQAPGIPDCGTNGDAEPASLTHEGDDWVLVIPAESPAQDRPVVISTASDGALMVAFEGNDPGSYCAFMSVGG